MQIRISFAIAFAVGCLCTAYLGLSANSIEQKHADKALHFGAFFIQTFLFYWMIDAPRKKILKFTIGICTITASIVSEFVQSIWTNSERKFDIFDIIANMVGSGLAAAASFFYHGRLLERRRQARYDKLRNDIELDANAATEETELPDLPTAEPEPINESTEEEQFK